MNGDKFSIASRSCRPAGRHRLSRVVLAVLIYFCAALSTNAQAPEAAADRAPIRIGFTHGIFKTQNEADVLAAMQVWAATIAEERGIRIDPDMRVYRSRSDAEHALRERQVDALTLLLDEYDGLPRDLIGGPFFRDEANGRTHEEFVVVSRADRDVSALSDLHGAKLAVYDSKYSGLASVWLDAQLSAAGLGTAGEVCSSVEYNGKLSAVVLGVFFGKHDAGLVSREGFMGMAELNPQVAKELRIVISAPPILPSFFCFRTNFDSARKSRFMAEVMRLHESVTGEQVLRVFKSDRMAELNQAQVDRSLALLGGWRTEVAEARNPSSPERGSAP